MSIPSGVLTRVRRSLETFATKPKEIAVGTYGECDFGKDVDGNDIRCTPQKAFKNKLGLLFRDDDVFFQVDADTFYKIFQRARRAQGTRGHFLINHPPKEFSSPGTTCYVNQSGSGGVTVKPPTDDGHIYIESACNMPESWPGRKSMGTTLLGVITLSGANTTNCLEPHLPRYTKYGWAPVAKMPFEKISPPRDWPENEPKYPRFSLVRVPNSYPRNQILELVTCKTQEAFDQATTAAVQRMYPRLKQPSNDPSLVVKSKTQTSQEGKPGSTPRQSSAQPVPQPSPPMEGQKLGSGTLHARRNSLSSRDNRATTQAAQSSHPGQAQGATGRRGVLAAARDKGRKVSSVMGWTR